MNVSSNRCVTGHAREFWGTLWPAWSQADSEFQRRRKIAVRSAQLAAFALIVVAIVAVITTNFDSLSGLRLGGLILAGMSYTGWNVIGTRDIVRVFLCEPGNVPPTVSLQNGRAKAFCYFAVQLGLASLICFFVEQNAKMGVLWLVLLPPVAHGVILLRAPGISVVCGVTVAIFAFFFVRWHGLDLLVNAVLAFAFGVLFTLIFTLLAVSSENARGEVQRLACELAEANGKLREYAVQAEELAVTRERNRLAREIHDSLGHYLTVVNVQIEAARVMVERDPGRARDALNKAQSLTQEGLRDIRRSVASLRAGPLDSQNLEQALRHAVEAMRQSGLAAEFRVTGKSRALSRQAELALFRAAQEGLTNIQKHAKATHASLVLDYSAAECVRLTLSDDGIGSTDQAPHGFGLLGLRERAHLVGGTVRIQTAPEAGFALEVEVPG